jgi:hypothetical protein
MSALSSLRVRLLVLLGLLAILIAGAASILLAREHKNATVSVPTTTTPHATQTQTSTSPVTPVPPHPIKTPPLLPVALTRALSSHAVVVVSVVVGSGAAESAARAEARAGAVMAGGGFLRVDAGSKAQAKAFTKLLGSDTQTPATLIVKRGGKLFVRIDGYADRLVIAQATRNARA